MEQQLPEHHDLTKFEYTKVVLRWRRLILRFREKAAWHGHGLLLWLLPRPHLRYAPFPYPSISHTKHWQDQAEAMYLQKPKALMHHHWCRARVQDAPVYTTKNVLELGQFRNRVGLDFAFMEDNLLQGMLAARSGKGIKAQLKREAIQEAQIEAEEAAKRGEKQLAVRELIGPKGGLPTLKGDLVKLAALLNIPVDTKMTIDDLKKACRPIVQDILNKPGSKASSSTGSTSSTDKRLPSKAAAPKSIMPRDAKSWWSERPRSSRSVDHARSHRFQQMLNQVLHSISTLHNARAGPDPTYNWSMSVDANMDETEHGWTAAEIRQMKRDYYEEDASWRRDNGIPPRDL